MGTLPNIVLTTADIAYSRTKSTKEDGVVKQNEKRCGFVRIVDEAGVQLFFRGESLPGEAAQYGD